MNEQHTAENDAGLAEHEIALRSLWRDLAEKRIESGVDWPRIVLTLFADLDALRKGVEALIDQLVATTPPPGTSQIDPGIRVADRATVAELRALLARVFPPGSTEEGAS